VMKTVFNAVSVSVAYRQRQGQRDKLNCSAFVFIYHHVLHHALHSITGRDEQRNAARGRTSCSDLSPSQWQFNKNDSEREDMRML